MAMRFEDKVALIIGGSSGIGLATARGLVAEGGRAMLAARDASRLEAVGAELRAAYPDRVAWVAGDVSELGEAERFVAATLFRFGRRPLLE